MELEPITCHIYSNTVSKYSELFCSIINIRIKYIFSIVTIEFVSTNDRKKSYSYINTCNKIVMYSCLYIEDITKKDYWGPLLM